MTVPLSSARILLTGGAGFLGSHVREALERHGARDIVVPRSKACDLRHAAATAKLFREVKPTLVMHLAARVGGIGANRRHPGTFFHDNMVMGVNVLEQARIHGTAKVVTAGTICAYPKFAPVPFKEDDLWNGYPEETNAPYGIAKKALLVMAQSYRQEFGSNFVTLFPVNLYGPKDNFDLEDSHVIPAMIRKFADAQAQGAPEVVLWGDGSPTREFLFVEDAAEAMALAAERYDAPDPVNVGSGEEIAMKDLARTIAELVGYRGTLRWDTSRPNGQPRRRLDVSRAKDRFGFSAKVGMAEGLARTLAWYRANEKAIKAAEAARA